METRKTIQMAKEYKGLIDRMNTSIQSLTSELALLKRYDVKLLKRFLHINEEIQNFHHKRAIRYRTSSLDNNNVFDQTVAPQSISILRRQSLPYFCRIQRIETLCSSGSSLEDLNEYPNDESPWVLMSADERGKENIFKYPASHMLEDWDTGLRYRSMSCAVDINRCDGIDDTELESILLRNVELWKYSRGDISEPCLNDNKFASIPTILITPSF